MTMPPRHGSTVTTARWRQLAEELRETAEAVEDGTMKLTDAEHKVGKLAAREALALRACEPLHGEERR